MGVHIISKPSIRFKNALRLCCAILVFILTIEVAARVDDWFQYGAPFWEEYTAGRLNAKDSEGIPHNVFNSRYEKWKNNQFGFRGPAIPIEKPEGIVRIVCMGTSETYGLYEGSEKEWPAQLRNTLNNSSRVQVINAAVVGLGLKSYKPYLQKYVLPFNPDIIILFINPFQYAAGMERALLEQSKHPRNAFKKRKKISTLSLRNIISTSRSFPKLKQAIKQIVPPKILKAYQIWDTKKQVQVAEKLYLDGKKPKDAIPENYLENFRIDLIDLIAFLHKTNDSYLILSSYPTLISHENITKYYEIILDNRKFCVEFSFKGLMDAAAEFNKIVEDVAAEHHTGFVDNDKLVPKTTTYFADNVHYTDEGAKFVANKFVEHLRNKIKLLQ